MRQGSKAKLTVATVLVLAIHSCKQGVDVGLEEGSSLMTADGTPLKDDPSYGEWGYESQSERQLDAVADASGLSLKGGGADDWEIVEGDIALNKKEGLNLASAEPNLWPNATVIYEFDPSFPFVQDLQRAMEVWTVEAGVQFRQRAGEPAFVFITSQGQGCWSHLGYTGRRQIINIGSECRPFGTKLHEVGHTLGLNHEQSRRDRDGFITLRLENVQQEARSNFNMGSIDIGPYDFNSVMHYGRFAFSTNGQATIETRNGEQIGQRAGLSDLDIAAVRQMYNTQGSAPGTSGAVFVPGQVTAGNITGQTQTAGVTPTTNVPMPPPTTSTTTGCAGFGGFDWSETYVRNQDGTCRDAKLSCTCWRTTAGTCGLYLPNGNTNVAGAPMVQGETNCNRSCDQVVRNGATTMRNQCQNRLITINAQGLLELWDYQNTNRDVISDIESP